MRPVGGVHQSGIAFFKSKLITVQYNQLEEDLLPSTVPTLLCLLDRLIAWIDLVSVCLLL